MSDYDSNGDLVDALMHIIESMQQCTHCGLHVDPSLHGGSCPCCNKSMTGRVLRDTTVDSSRIDYSGLDGDDCVNSKESIYEPALTSRGPTYRSCTSHGPAVGQLPPLYRMYQPDDPEQPVANEPCRRPARHAVMEETDTRQHELGESLADQDRYIHNVSAEARNVLREFRQLLIRDGYRVGRGDGTATKYCRYMQMLFENDIFTSRDDFFKPAARSRAHAFYMQCAQKKAQETDCRTSVKKLYKNFANGFDKFVLLANFETAEVCTQVSDNVTLDDIIDLLQ